MKKDSFYIYGKKPIEEQLMRHPENVMRIFISDVVAGNSQEFDTLKRFAQEKKIPVNAISKHKLGEYVGEVNTQGIIALVRRAEYMTFDEWESSLDLETNPVVVILDQIEDTHNFGAILRSAAAVGASAVFVAKDHQAPINGTVFKTSAGALLRVAIVQVSNINQVITKLQKMKFWVAALDMDEEGRSQSLWDQDFSTPTAFVVGSEGKGVSKKVREHADFILSLPMHNGVESLNVSVACAVALYEWRRQQDKKTR